MSLVDTLFTELGPDLIPTLLSLSTASLPFNVLSTSLHQVATYMHKFQGRLSPANLLHLQSLVAYLESLKKYTSSWKEETLQKLKAGSSGPQKTNPRTEVITLVELTRRLGKRVVNINLLEIEKYLKKSKVARKIAGYSEKQAERDAGTVLQCQLIKDTPNCSQAKKESNTFRGKGWCHPYIPSRIS